MTFELTPDETTAVLRWVPHLEADRKVIAGPVMTLEYFDESPSGTVALVQIVIAIRLISSLASMPDGPPVPRVIVNDVGYLTNLSHRVSGLSPEEIAVVKQLARAEVEGDDEHTKH